jgi:hypothetical protein
MKMISLILYAFLVFIFLHLTFCSAQPTLRYEDRNKETEKSLEITSEKDAVQLKENFDITPFRTQINLPDKKIDFSKSSNDVWYLYDVKDNVTVKSKTIKGTTNGFRVQVIATDDLDEANRIQEELKAIKGSNEIYSVFEPPFYKILIGDFKTSEEANSLRFKLNQLGYSDSKVVKSSINIFE